MKELFQQTFGLLQETERNYFKSIKVILGIQHERPSYNLSEVLLIHVFGQGCNQVVNSSLFF